ncbi:hypothetical protein BDB01DRAFT_782748 [Pilobolus umbonatus]|nr:hypothetical protein BDB01DRAFT_782748 [Pilobolus umbonatus]
MWWRSHMWWALRTCVCLSVYERDDSFLMGILMFLDESSVSFSSNIPISSFSETVISISACDVSIGYIEITRSWHRTQ